MRKSNSPGRKRDLKIWGNSPRAQGDALGAGNVTRRSRLLAAIAIPPLRNRGKMKHSG
jgi:hypothetical protein